MRLYKIISNVNAKYILVYANKSLKFNKNISIELDKNKHKTNFV